MLLAPHSDDGSLVPLSIGNWLAKNTKYGQSQVYCKPHVQVVFAKDAAAILCHCLNAKDPKASCSVLELSIPPENLKSTKARRAAVPASDRRKFRSQTSDNIWTDEKHRWEESEKRREEKRREEERRSEKRKSQKKEDADSRKGRTVAKHWVFPMICGPGGSKSRLSKAAKSGAIWRGER